MKIEIWNEHQIRFVNKDGEWWAVAVDVCSALGIKNVSLAINGNPVRKSKKDGSKGLAEHQKDVCNAYTLGGKQEVIIISESGVYKLIMRSNKKEAEEFQDWAFEIIKTLRKSTGLEGYEIFKTLDPKHQKEAMDKLKNGLEQVKAVDYIKANTIANKAVSNIYGYPKMVKKGDMTPEMLADRQRILEDTVKFMGLANRYDLDISVSKTIYNGSANKQKVS